MGELFDYVKPFLTYASDRVHLFSPTSPDAADGGPQTYVVLWCYFHMLAFFIFDGQSK